MAEIEEGVARQVGDARQLHDVLKWSQRAFPYDGALIREAAPIGAPSPVIAAFNLALAYSEALEQGDSEETAYHLGIGLNGLATELKEDGNIDAARDTFQAAYRVLVGMHDRDGQPEHFRKAIRFSFANLKALGVAQPTTVPLPALPAEPFIPLADLVGQVRGIDVGEPPQFESVASTESPAAELPESPVPEPEWVPSVAELLARYADYWVEDRFAIETALGELRQYLSSQLGRSGILSRDLGSILDEDAAVLAEALRDGLPVDRAQLEDAAQRCRRFAFQTRNDAQERRRRWLATALMNTALWKIPHGFSTNEPQVQIDLLGYLGGILMDQRYSDADRDLLLDCAESEVRIAHKLTQVVFNRFGYIRDWVLSAVGTYLLLAGPDPASPSDSYYDPRIQSDVAVKERGLQRAERFTWPELLLGQWQSVDEQTAGACYALAGVAGWDSARARWLIGAIFAQADDPRRELDREFWSDRVGSLLARIERVRVATNPWGAHEASATRGSMITSDEAGRFIIPDPVVKAAVAQGIDIGDAITVHGDPFGGRRVPTYLLTNRFGPFAILKIDYERKVLREVHNFRQYARRLHQSHRPSECKAHEMVMHLGENGAPLRAIETAYVFEEAEKPTTLAAWLRGATPEDAVTTLTRFLFSDLRPWLAHVRRDRVDLRAEYPVIRSAPAPTKQSPNNWAATELRRLEVEDVRQALGFGLDRTERHPSWIDEFSEWEPAGDRPVAVNPLWLAAELGELGAGELRSIVDSFDVAFGDRDKIRHPLRDFETLLALSHGDLHAENALCTNIAMGTPRTVLIDFESTHEGHVCKDPARLEASLLCQVFDWADTGETGAVATWFLQSLMRVFEPSPLDGSQAARTCASVCTTLRKIVFDCGQRQWPISDEEYILGLFGQLLPMVRYSTLNGSQRRFALICATAAASALVAAWTESAAH